jgi:hypothetical protein
LETTNAAYAGSLQLVLLLCILIPAILFLLTQQNTLKQIRPENRSLAPGSVWLQLIPLVGQVWQFFVVSRIASSIQREVVAGDDNSILGFADVASVEAAEDKPTQGIGIAYCTLSVLVIVLNTILRVQGDLLLGVVAFASLGSAVCWIVYWVKLAGWKRKLKQRAALVAA